MPEQKHSPAVADLRFRVDQQVGPDKQNPQMMLPPEQLQQALHDLRVHQIELEMQNEELRRVQAELETSRERYFDLYDLAPVGYFTLNEKGLILEANLTAAKLLGVERKALVKQRLTRFILPEDQDIYYKHRKALFNTGLPQVCEMRLMKESGASFWVCIEASARQEADGELVCRAVMSDITARKQMEEKFLRTQRLESIGTLASGIAHDLNNILTPIILSTDLLRMTKESDTNECLITSIEECAHRGANIVNQLLVFARGTKGERTILPLTHLVGEIEKLIFSTFPKNIIVSSSIPSGLWSVKGDSTQIHQVLLNLCINARDAMPEGGTLLISAANQEIDENFAAMAPDAKAGEYVMLAIADSGAFIPRENIAKIFDPFFTTKEIGKGTGLGLSTVMGIIRSHGGFITVESEEGRGCTFKVFLPREAGDATKQKHLPPTKIPKSKGGTILLVDDEIYIAQVTAMVLEKNGYKVLAAAGGTEALDLYEKHAEEIKLVITDVMMPGMNGVELTRTLKKINPLVKIVASTGQATEIHQTELRNLGVNMILSKPYSAHKLLSALRETLHEECV